MLRPASLAVLALLALVPQAAAAQRGAKQTTYALIRCESPGGRESFCPADTRRGVRLVNTVSGRCQLGRGWGYDATGIWVRGCSAEFEIGQRGDGGGWGWGFNEGSTLTCASEKFRYTLCQANTRGGVRLVNQISRAECTEGRSWGSDRRGIWVDQGCAGEFEIGGAGAAGPGTGRPPPPAGLGGYPATGDTFRCESVGGRRTSCAVELRGRGITVVNNLSREPCEEGRNFGIERRGVWVDAGCRADFRIIEAGRGDDRRDDRDDRGRRGDEYEGGDDRRGRGDDYEDGDDRGRGDRESSRREVELGVVRCESKEFRRRSCATGDASRAELRRQISRAQCIEGQTWGFDRDGLWVDQGCAADFATFR
jgi:hypothetical protein